MSTHAERIAELGMEDLRWAYRVKRVHDDATDAIAQMEWDAVIANHDRAVKAEALREAADDWGDIIWQDVWADDGVEDDVSAVQSTVKWLYARADEMETTND